MAAPFGLSPCVAEPYNGLMAPQSSPIRVRTHSRRNRAAGRVIVSAHDRMPNRATITSRYPGRCRVCGRPIQVGDRVEWTKESGAKHLACATGGAATAPSPKRVAAPSRPRQSTAFVGAKGQYQADFQADRNDRTPQRHLGTVSWLKMGSDRVPVVLVGYEPAQYIRGEDAEDMGHYGVENGYYGTLHFRAATAQEAGPLRAEAEGKAGTAKAIADRLSFVERTILAGERVPEHAAHKALATVESQRGAAVATRLDLSKLHKSGPIATVYLLTDGSVVGTHPGHYDDYRASAWLHDGNDALSAAIRSLGGK